MSDEPTTPRSGHILSDVLGGNVVYRDVPGAPPGTHDFDLTSSDNRIIAVEVTISTDQKGRGVVGCRP